MGHLKRGIEIRLMIGESAFKDKTSAGFILKMALFWEKFKN